MAEVTLEVFALPDLTPVFSDSISICTTYPYQLDPGNYRVRATYTATGEVKEQDVTILEAQTTPINFTFTAPSPEYWFCNVSSSPSEGGTTDPVGDINVLVGESRTVTAYSNSGYMFDHWLFDGANYGSASPTTIPSQTANSSHTLVAVFSPVGVGNWYVTINSSPVEGGSTIPTGFQTVLAGETLSVVATPSIGYEFDHWQSDISEVNGKTTLSITVPAQTEETSHTLTAHFRMPILRATIQGYVTDERLTPIAGATVKCNGYTDISETNGFYQFTDVPTKTYTLTFSKIGYGTQKLSVDASAGGTFTADTVLTPSKPFPWLIIAALISVPIIGGVIYWISKPKK